MQIVKNKFRLIAVILLTTLLAVSCAPVQEINNATQPPSEEVTEPAPIETEEQEEPAQDEEEAMPLEAEVSMQSNTFQPAELTIAIGTTVTWTNDDAVDHTVTSGTRGSTSGEFEEIVAPGGSFTYTFEEAGQFDYYCSFHPGMDGTVIVEE